MHPDHSAGLTDPETGRRLFPNAELVVHENEPRHWDDDAAMARASERAKKLYFQAAREQMAPYRDRLRLFSTGGEVFPGVRAVLLHGHTPGHCGYLISSGSESLLVWGDIIHVPEIQVPRPEVTMEFDTDPVAAAATRRRTFEMVANERLLVAGMHIHFPGFAHLVHSAGGYAMLPEPWVQAF
jgi:glyoxylase-like metal-dependent hydrolase (beta-lactamase superfamily II)